MASFWVTSDFQSDADSYSSHDPTLLSGAIKLGLMLLFWLRNATGEEIRLCSAVGHLLRLNLMKCWVMYVCNQIVAFGFFYLTRAKDLCWDCWAFPSCALSISGCGERKHSQLPPVLSSLFVRAFCHILFEI